MESENREIYSFLGPSWVLITMAMAPVMDSSEKTIAILGYRRWLQTAKHDGDKVSNIYVTWKKT